MESHFIPAALYPKGKTLNFATRTASGVGPAEVIARLLCDECEGRFNRNGESEVLRLLAPKITRKSLPILPRLRIAPRIGVTPDGFPIYSGPSVGIDTRKFAYFALSLAWRASAHRWTLPDGTFTESFDLGRHEDPIRRFLLDEGDPFPSEVAVVMTFCTDDSSRAIWIAPTPAVREDYNCLLYRIQVVGVILIAYFGSGLPNHIKAHCCASAPERPFVTADCAQVTRDMLSGLQPL